MDCVPEDRLAVDVVVARERGGARSERDFVAKVAVVGVGDGVVAVVGNKSDFILVPDGVGYLLEEFENSDSLVGGPIVRNGD